MRRLVCLCLLLLAVTAAAQDKGGLAPGSDVPATFHPYNVTERIDPTPETPTDKDKDKKKEPRVTKRKYHCLVTDYDMDPVVMLVARNLDDSAGFRDLLTKLDAAVERNRLVRLRCFVAAVYDDLTDTVKQDEKRDAYATRLEKLAEDLKLRGVVLTLSTKDDLKAFKLDDEAALNAVLYRKLKVEAVHNVGRDKLAAADSADAKAVLGDVAAKLGAKR